MKRVTSIITLTTLFLFAIFLPASAQVKDWTVAIFLNADNNLDPFGVEDQSEMARVGSNASLNIVTLIDRERGPAQINFIEKNSINKIKDMGELDMGDYRELVKFARFIKENYPAKHYCFTIWNHGSGWKNKKVNSIFRGISYDDSSNNHITNAQLGLATAEIAKILGQKVDILNMDACLMQMVEVGHAVKDNVRFMVASEELEPGKGAPYDDILKGVKKGMTPAAFATNWVNAFAKSYTGGSQGHDESTQSAVDMSKFGAMVDAINGLAKAVMSGKYSADVKAALATTQKFDSPENIDMIHFTEQLKARLSSNESIKTACDKLLTASKAAVINSKNTGYTTKDAKGIAIYLPASFRVEAKYRSLCFAKENMWDEMIDTLLKRDIAASIVSDIRAGSLDELRHLVAATAENPESADLYRYVLRELNYEMYTENALPESLADEFKVLFTQLTAATRR
ncbi:MAG: hypothetical protein CVV42_17970 [Candidatus Riflebacteria bacterium HGW-Riflebacteria-2]|jgi:hypothetical protein|nr:MAG: hypothetical protein CVV42_17970 [Candidatus Riflebacteria bacterium HGW-Riflebacteria-2]